MGGTVSANSASLRYQFDPRSWTVVGEGDTYRILRNTGNGEELEEYLHTATDNKEFAHLRSIFQYRLDKDYLVGSKYFRQEDRSEMCSSFFQGFLYTERIPLRMNEIKDLPFPDTLHLVNACLRGFRELYLKTGGFEVNDHMIGINSDAKVKVWMSEDFGSERPVDSVQRDERVMVCRILEIIDKNIDKRTQPQSITLALTRGGPPSFDQAIALLNEYTIRNVISIPSCLVSIAELRDKGYFKKMPPKGRFTNSLRSPLEPSINRSLPFIGQSALSSDSSNVVFALPNQQLHEHLNTVPNSLPPRPRQVTINQPITTLNAINAGYQSPILSPLSVPLTSAISPDFPGVTQTVHNHLQYQGHQPLMSLAQKYPPPVDYSPLNPPPPHIRGHKTEVRSFMSPPITRSGSVERIVHQSVAPTLTRPGTPVFGNSFQLPPNQVLIPTPPQYLPTPPIIPQPTYQQSQQISHLTEKYLKKSPSNMNLGSPRPIAAQFHSAPSLNHHYSEKSFSPSPLPMIVIPNKIQLTVTKITNRQPEGVAVENFILNPNQSNVHSSLIKEILQHTIGLQNALKEGAYHNPTIEGQKITEEIRLNESKDFSRATTANYTQHSTPYKHSYEHTDPALLERTIRGLGTIIDHQKSTSEFNFSNNQAFQTTFGYDSFRNVNTSGLSYMNSIHPVDNSSPEIMAIVSQALSARREGRHQKMSEISEIESVNYDSKLGSYA